MFDIISKFLNNFNLKTIIKTITLAGVITYFANLFKNNFYSLELEKGDDIKKIDNFNFFNGLIYGHTIFIKDDKFLTNLFFFIQIIFVFIYLAFMGDFYTDEALLNPSLLRIDNWVILSVLFAVIFFFNYFLRKKYNNSVYLVPFFIRVICFLIFTTLITKIFINFVILPLCFAGYMAIKDNKNEYENLKKQGFVIRGQKNIKRRIGDFVIGTKDGILNYFKKSQERIKIVKHFNRNK